MNTVFFPKVLRALESTPILDMHTHLYPPDWMNLDRWGIDAMLTYHYLVAETLRYVDMPYARFFSMPRQEMADLVWKKLFIEHSPVSEAALGVLTVLKSLGLDPDERDLKSYRAYFRDITPEAYVNTVFDKAGIDRVVMTNWPLKKEEYNVWMSGKRPDERFLPALRIDPIINEWETCWSVLQDMGYNVSPVIDSGTKDEVRRFLRDWIIRMKPVYLCASMPPEFMLPSDTTGGVLFEECIMTIMEEFGLPVAIMLGAKKGVNPRMALGGDGEGKAHTEVLEYLCNKYPHQKFLVTMLARENMHELAVAARKFRNLMPFGCWWFMNNPSLIDELMRMRVEMLGTSFIPQHSDAIIVDQLIYKWSHSRPILARVLADRYEALAETGFQVTDEEIRRDAELLLNENFVAFCNKQL